MSDIDVMSNNYSEQENDDSHFKQEHVLSVVSSKCYAEEIIALMMIKRTLWSECLSLYYRKIIQEHLDFCCSAETVFFSYTQKLLNWWSEDFVYHTISHKWISQYLISLLCNNIFEE